MLPLPSRLLTHPHLHTSALLSCIFFCATDRRIPSVQHSVFGRIGVSFSLTNELLRGGTGQEGGYREAKGRPVGENKPEPASSGKKGGLSAPLNLDLNAVGEEQRACDVSNCLGAAARILLLAAGLKGLAWPRLGLADQGIREVRLSQLFERLDTTY